MGWEGREGEGRGGEGDEISIHGLKLVAMPLHVRDKNREIRKK